MERVDISESEILEELQQVMQGGTGPDDAHTTSELARVLGTSQRVVRKRLRPLIREGKVEAVRVRRLRMDGVMNEVPAYRLVDQAA